MTEAFSTDCGRHPRIQVDVREQGLLERGDQCGRPNLVRLGRRPGRFTIARSARSDPANGFSALDQRFFGRSTKRPSFLLITGGRGSPPRRPGSFNRS